MSVKIRMHYDGKNFIPDEPIEVPVNQSFDAELHIETSEKPLDDFERRRLALHKTASRGVRGITIPLEALRREHLYED